ncbi:hypothetical protein ElyMa_001867100 [Elysia marginata]|uniref:Uncharacterized protein n=1 Tax=Elysia marginata TaxID=1093978 RepID=A0AAV4EN55_9GAST|nr:hypothetical protein ElyMa_001867100 [Elysia marginata]
MRDQIVRRPNLWFAWCQSRLLVLGTSEVVSLWEACQHPKAYTVKKNQVYQVMSDGSDLNTTSTVISCKLTFSAETRVGRLCVRQDYPKILVADKLSLLSAKSQHDVIFACQSPYDQSWDDIEKCSYSSPIHIIFRNKNPSQPVDLRKVRFNLKVVDITSRHRKFDMTYEDCGKRYSLHHSEVSVYNRLNPQQQKRETAVQARSVCMLDFSKIPNEGRRICIVYIPLGRLDCSSDWKLLFLNQSPQPMYTLNCTNDPRATKPQAVCAPKNLDIVQLSHEVSFCLCLTA